nr:hypothetical protein [uncultured Flavobacterium sp.]
MELVELKLNISVTYAPMTKDQYKKIEQFFYNAINDLKINNEELIDFLAIDKRPFAVSSISQNKPNENFESCEINLIC